MPAFGRLLRRLTRGYSGLGRILYFRKVSPLCRPLLVPANTRAVSQYYQGRKINARGLALRLHFIYSFS